MGELNYTYNIVKNDDTTNVTVFVPGDSPLVADNTHPNFDKIVAIIQADILGEPLDTNVDFLGLFDIAEGIRQRFLYLSDRVTVNNGRVYFDLEEIDNSLTRQILRFVEEGIEDWEPLVNFYENIAANPNEHSREQLFDWLNAHDDLSITSDGLIVGYKGVKYIREGDGFKGVPEELADEYPLPEQDGPIGWSTFSGSAYVDGVKVDGYIPYPLDATVEMPRGDVVHDPSTACSTGLHVGTFNYAQAYGRGGNVIEVHVNPRDVVSVPRDAHGEKVRVCRLYVADVDIEGKYAGAVKNTTPEAPVPDPPAEPKEPIKDDFVKASGKDIEKLSKLAKERKRGFERTALAQGWEKRFDVTEDDEGDDQYDWFRPVQWRLPLTAK